MPALPDAAAKGQGEAGRTRAKNKTKNKNKTKAKAETEAEAPECIVCYDALAGIEHTGCSTCPKRLCTSCFLRNLEYCDCCSTGMLVQRCPNCRSYTTVEEVGDVAQSDHVRFLFRVSGLRHVKAKRCSPMAEQVGDEGVDLFAVPCPKGCMCSGSRVAMRVPV